MSLRRKGCLWLTVLVLLAAGGANARADADPWWESYDGGFAYFATDFLDLLDNSEAHPLVEPASYRYTEDAYCVYLTGTMHGQVRYMVYTPPSYGGVMLAVRMWLKNGADAEAASYYSANALLAARTLAENPKLTEREWMGMVDGLEDGNSHFWDGVGIAYQKGEEGEALTFFLKDREENPSNLPTRFMRNPAEFFANEGRTAEFVELVEAFNFYDAYLLMVRYCKNGSLDYDFGYQLGWFMEDANVFVIRERCTVQEENGVVRVYTNEIPVTAEDVPYVPYLECVGGEISFGLIPQNEDVTYGKQDRGRVAQALLDLQVLHRVYSELVSIGYNWETYYQ